MERGPNHQLKNKREATPSSRLRDKALSRTELAALVAAHVYRAHGRIVSVDRNYIAKLERGTIRWPGKHVREALRAVLNVEADHEIGLICTANMEREYVPLAHADDSAPIGPVGPVDLTHTPWTVDGAKNAARVLSEVSPVNRRTFCQIAPGALLALSMDSLVARAAKGATRQARGTIEATEDDLTTLGHVGDELRRMDDRRGGGVVLALAQGHLRHVVDLLKGARYGETVGRGLHSYTAEMMRFCGWLSWDVGRHSQAEQYWVAALHCAQVAGDDQVRANVLVYMAGLSLEMGRTEEATRMGAAARLCLHGSPRVAAAAHAQFAEAAAAAGAHREASEAIDSAWSAFERAASPDSGTGPAWAYWVDRGHVSEMTARARMLLGDHRGAIDGLRSYIAKTTPGREQARGLIFLSQAYAKAGEPDEASRVAMGAVALLSDGDVVSQRSHDGVRRARHALKHYDTAAVRELDERLAGIA